VADLVPTRGVIGFQLGFQLGFRAARGGDLDSRRGLSERGWLVPGGIAGAGSGLRSPRGTRLRAGPRASRHGLPI
jgi:hypothetical protein